MANNILYSNCDFTFGVELLDDAGAILAGGSFSVAVWRLFEGNETTPIVTKTLGAGVTASSGTESFTVTYEETDITVESFAFNAQGILAPNGRYFRHEFYVGTLAGDKFPAFVNERVEIYQNTQ